MPQVEPIDMTARAIMGLGAFLILAVPAVAFWLVVTA